MRGMQPASFAHELGRSLAAILADIRRDALHAGVILRRIEAPPDGPAGDQERT